ncbi:hypothetical protein BH09PSE5_BH09PSE5_50510 [soil metagenome]
MLTRVKDAARFVRTAGLSVGARALSWHATERREESRLKIRSGSFVAASELAADAAENEPYEATGYSTLMALFRRIAPAEPEERQVLLDAGCGMGRAMVYAATFPYTRVLGFDISPMLIDKARQNIQNAAGSLRCSRIDAEVASAVEYEVPDDVTTIFCFNPFNGSTMERFLARVGESMERQPRELTLAFANPHLSKSAAEWLEPVDSFDCFDPRMGPKHGYRQRVAVFRFVPRLAARSDQS